MTVIAYRDGVMAADSGSWSGSAVFAFARKLARGPDGTLYGVTGTYAEASAFLAWVDGGYIGAEPAPRRKSDTEGTGSFSIAGVLT